MKVRCIKCSYQGEVESTVLKRLGFIGLCVAIGSFFSVMVFDVSPPWPFIIVLSFFVYAYLGGGDGICPECGGECLPAEDLPKNSEVENKAQRSRLQSSLVSSIQPKPVQQKTEPATTYPDNSAITSQQRPSPESHHSAEQSFEEAISQLVIPDEDSLCACSLVKPSNLAKLTKVISHYNFLASKGELSVPSVSAILARELETLKSMLRSIDCATENEIRQAIVARLHSEKLEVPEDLEELPCEVGISSASLIQQFSLAKTEEEQGSALNSLCRWLVQQAEPMLRQLVREDWVDKQAELLVFVRSGSSKFAWSARKRGREVESPRASSYLKTWMKEHPGQLEYFWYVGKNNASEAVLSLLEEVSRKSLPTISPEEILSSWSVQLSEEEKASILGQRAAEVQPDDMLASIKDQPQALVSASSSTTTKEAFNPPYSEAQKSKRETQHLASSLKQGDANDTSSTRSDSQVATIWQEYVAPFVSENWYMVAGILMLVLGSSLLAFYTWDKHWLLRYTIMPSLLALLTISVARIGNWIEGKDRKFFGSAVLLRGTAIALLPVNFMALALLAQDQAVPHRVLVFPLMASLYLLLFGYLLATWCSAVSPLIKGQLGKVLLLINSLVMLLPLVRHLSKTTQMESLSESALFLIAAGFYLGFSVLAYAVYHFATSLLEKIDREEGSGRARIVAWFFGCSLGITFFEVFAWVHGSLGVSPQPHLYAPMVILLGWLLLFVESRVNEKKKLLEEERGESFLGFSLIFLGILFGLGSPSFRVISLLLASGVWLYQARLRRSTIHYWLSLTLLMLGLASIGLLDLFRKELLPALAIGISIVFGAISLWLSPSNAHSSLDSPSEKLSTTEKSHSLSSFYSACLNMQSIVLLLASGITLLTQLHFRRLPTLLSSPAISAAYLLIIGGIFVLKARAEQQLRLLHTAMVIFALALPYLGCVNMHAPAVSGNTMVFGLAILSILWLFLIWLSNSKLALQARSTVIFVYGGIAVTAMILRVLFETEAQLDPFSARAIADYLGPVLMSIVLVLTTYYSRSLIPALMAAIIIIVLLPELRSVYSPTFPKFAWGSGLGSSVIALLLLASAFRLRQSSFLANLSKGDLFLNKFEFPLKRHDHTLFTWPLLVSVIYLLLRVISKFHYALLNSSMVVETAWAVTLSGIAWAVVAIYFRKDRLAFLAASVSPIVIGFGVVSIYATHSTADKWSSAALICGISLQIVYYVYRYLLARKYPWILELLGEPLRLLLAISTVPVTLLCVLSVGVSGISSNLNLPLAIFLALQLCWHGLRYKSRIFGTFLFFLLWLLLTSFSGESKDRPFAINSEGDLFRHLNPSILLCLSISLLLPALGFASKRARQSLMPLVEPLNLLASVLGILICLVGLIFLPAHNLFSPLQLAAVCLLVFLTARNSCSTPLALLALLAGWVVFNQSWLASQASPPFSWSLLRDPWDLSLLAAYLAISGRTGEVLTARFPKILASTLKLPLLSGGSISWIYIPAALAALSSTFIHAGGANYVYKAEALPAPYLAALVLGLLALWLRSRMHLILAVLAATVANISVVNAYCGVYLLQRGLSVIHLFGLGVAASLLQICAANRLISDKRARSSLSNAGLLLASSVIALLSLNYFVHPNLAAVTSERFIVSGLMALLAGLYFRSAVNSPEPSEKSYRPYKEAMYHYSLAMALWCAALVIPWFRTSATALIALSAPLLYFYLNAETRRGNEASAYRNSAAALGFLILGLYTFRSVFQMVMFPEDTIGTEHYHYNSPLLIVVSIILLRLRSLGGTSWQSFYGGLGLMLGTYFALTALPGLSPFVHPVRGAWSAILLAHFWTLVSNQRSPLTTALQALGGLGEEEWRRLRRPWGSVLVVSTQVAMLWGICAPSSDTYSLAPLLLGGASILLHHAYLRSSTVLGGVSVLELLIALHADFITPSYLVRDHIIWVGLGLWCLIFIVYYLARLASLRHLMPLASIGFAVLTLAHIFYHHPASLVGLWGMAIGGVLAGITPCASAKTRRFGHAVAAGLLLLIPTWLVFFSQYSTGSFELSRMTFVTLDFWPIIACNFTVLLTGIFLQLSALNKSQEKEHEEQRATLFSSTLYLSRNYGEYLSGIILCCVFLLTALVQVVRYTEPFTSRELMLMLCSYAGLSIAWFVRGRTIKSMAAHYLVQLSILGFFAVARRQLMLVYPEYWNYEFDIWASLLVSLGLGGAKQIWNLEHRSQRVPIITTLFAMPVIALIWTLVHGLGTDVALLVVGLHSVNFAFLGRDEDESPYHLVAVAGFVAFVVIFFVGKLELHFVHSYIIPLGLGVLSTLQLFRRRVTAETKYYVRLVTLLVMLGSTGYYALLDPRYTLVFNLSFALLSLFVMALGTFLSIKLYLLIGFSGLMVNVLSLFVKSLLHIQRGPRMTLVGTLVLCMGALLVFGSVYYKANREKIATQLATAREYFRDWE